ncbi:MAG: amidase [Chloroflexi bacterium]|nr:amidase [Chloroflexota bacterium]
MNDDAITRLTIEELLAAQHAGTLRATDIIAAYLTRAAAVNPRINAIVARDDAAARAAAQAADAACAAGGWLGPLHGIPLTVKDWIDVAGLPCTMGEERHRDRRPADDALAVARLRAAGAVVLGKTNVAIENALFGRTRNPHALGYSPEGSSSGEAAAIAARCSAGGLGSDSGGSIRQPAHACGIVGIKPSAGRVPLTGHAPFISALNDPRTVIGPMARTVADAARLLAVIAGADASDPSTAPVPLDDWRAQSLRGVRVAWYTHHAEADPPPPVVAACVRAADALAAAGAHVVQRLPPRIEEAWPITRDYWARPESLDAGQWLPDGPARLSSMAVERHLFVWDRFRRAMSQFMQHVDLILTPTAERPAARFGSPGGGIPYTLPYSLTGQPAVSVPAGLSDDGLPIGVQVVAARWRDDLAVAAAAVIEAAGGGWCDPPLRSA